MNKIAIAGQLKTGRNYKKPTKFIYDTRSETHKFSREKRKITENQSALSMSLIEI